MRNDQLGCVTLFLAPGNGESRVEGYVTSKYLYVWWAPWYFNGDKIQVKQLDMTLSQTTGEFVNLPYYTLTTEQWGVIWAVDYTNYLVMYECMYDWFGFMANGILTDQINIFVRYGTYPSPTTMATIKTTVAAKGPLIDMTPANLEEIQTSSCLPRTYWSQFETFITGPDYFLRDLG